MKEVVVNLIKVNAKAIVAFVLSCVTLYLTKRGLNASPDVIEGLRTVVEAALMSLCVWLVPNSTKAK